MARDDARWAPSATPPVRWQSHPRGHAPAPRLDPPRESGAGSARHAREVPTVWDRTRVRRSPARDGHPPRAARAGKVVLATTMLAAGTRGLRPPDRGWVHHHRCRTPPGLDAQRPGRCPSRTRAGPWLKRSRAAWSADPRKHLTAADPGAPLPALIVPRPAVADRDSASRALGKCIHSEAPPGMHDMEHSAPPGRLRR